MQLTLLLLSCLLLNLYRHAIFNTNNRVAKQLCNAVVDNTRRNTNDIKDIFCKR